MTVTGTTVKSMIFCRIVEVTVYDLREGVIR